MADKLALERRLTSHNLDLRRYILPNDNWIVETRDARIGKNIDAGLYSHASEPMMRRYWCKRRNWTDEIFSSVAWEPLEAAMHSLPRQRRNWIGKHVTGVCGVNSVLLKWKQRDDDHCPRCGAIETANHVWQCQGSGAAKIWADSLESLAKWLTSVGTEPTLQLAILENLREWTNGTNVLADPRSSLALAQDLIGRQYLIEGILCQAWVTHQQAFFHRKGRLQNGK